MRTIYYFTNIAPHYRAKLWGLLAEEDGIAIHFAFGESYTSSRIASIPFSFPPFRPDRLHRLRNISLKNILFWQSGTLKLLLTKQMDDAIFLGDMFVLSNWIGALICRIRGIRVIFWGHGFSGAESRLKRQIRILFNRLADHHLLYGYWSRNLMMSYGFLPEKLTVVYNSLDYDESKKRRSAIHQATKQSVFPFFTSPHLPVLVFIGRLTAVKKLYLLIQAVKKLNQTDIGYNLLIVGNGDQATFLKTLGKEGIQKGYIHFYGPCYDESQNSLLLGLSDLCVSPGNIGLTVIHSLSYGTPACTHSNFNNQMPEFEAIIEGKTGFFFEENDVESLVNNIQDWFVQHPDREAVRKACYEIVDNTYNPYSQLIIFKKILCSSPTFIES